MKHKAFATLGIAALALSLTACNTGQASQSLQTPIGGDIIAPVTQEVSDLRGTDVQLKVGQVLNIKTGGLPVDNYTAEVSDSAIVEFVQGRKEASAEFNPGFTAKSIGTTDVTMTPAQGGVQVVTFTITVVE